MTTYLGLDVLETIHNARESEVDTIPASLSVFDPGPGKVAIQARETAARYGRRFQWTCATRAQIAALKAFLETRCGKAVPFWVPTWRQDMSLALEAGSLGNGLTIEPEGYTKFIFESDLTNGRRHLMLKRWDNGSIIYRKITNAVDNGTSEVLTLDSVLGVTFPVGSLVSFLTLCRLDTDEVEISYLTDSIAECSLPFVAIPENAP